MYVEGAGNLLDYNCKVTKKYRDMQIIRSVFYVGVNLNQLLTLTVYFSRISSMRVGENAYFCSYPPPPWKEWVVKWPRRQGYVDDKKRNMVLSR